MNDTPEKIGKYPIKSKLGVGATSTVYLADDPFVGREVANPPSPAACRRVGSISPD